MSTKKRTVDLAAVILRGDSYAFYLGRHFGFEHCIHILSAQFVFSLYNLKNELSHVRGIFEVLLLFPSTLFEGRTMSKSTLPQ